LRQLSCQLLRFRTYLFYRSANIEILLVWSNSIFGMLKSYWLSGQKFLYSDFKDIGLEKTDFGRNNFINLKISSFWIKASSASFLGVNPIKVELQLFISNCRFISKYSLKRLRGWFIDNNLFKADTDTV